MRTFIAIPVEPDDVLREVLSELAAMDRGIRAVAPNNLHITLRFLGETSQQQAEAVAAALQESLSDVKSFRCELIGLGAFPNARRPSVVWVGCRDEGRIGELVDRLEQPLAAAGFPPERRPFHPHLTLARVRNRPPAALSELLVAQRERHFQELFPDRVQFVESTLTPSGSHYSSIDTSYFA